MDIRPIRTEADLAWALAEVEVYFDDPPAKGTPAADRFDVLSTLITAYEDAAFAIPASDPIDVLRFAIDDMGRSQVELGAILGSRSRASEILSGKRPLTLPMILTISEAWRIPVAALVPKAAGRRAA